MSDLQLALVIVGVALVAAVFLYNKWQESRYRKQAEAGFGTARADVLLKSSVAAEEPAVARVEPTLVATHSPSAGRRYSGPLSETIDYIVTIEPSSPVQGRAVLDAAAAALRQIRKRAYVEGNAGAAWEPVREDAQYAGVRTGLQLVDRNGAAREEDLSAFTSAVQSMARALGGSAVASDRAAALDIATRLDRMCDQVDIQVAVHLTCSGEPFAGPRLRSLAEGFGLKLEKDGRFRYRDELEAEVFTLARAEGAAFSEASIEELRASKLSLELDVPRAAGGTEAFDAFRDCAERLAAALGGTLVDDNLTPLGSAAFDAIRIQLEPVYEAMRSQGIPAGSPLALRLFS